MKRFAIVCILCAMLLAGLQGCRKVENEESSAPAASQDAPQQDTAGAETQPPTEEATQAPVQTHDLGQVDPETEHILDPDKVLDTALRTSLNQSAAKIARQYHLNLTIDIVQKLGDQKPAAYAQADYEALYPADSSGVLFLINNDTGEDYLYVSGDCGRFLTDSVCTELLIRISPMLAVSDYQQAVQTVLDTIAEVCPAHVFDQAGAMDPADIADLEDTAKQLYTSKKLTAVVCTSEDASQEAADALFEKLYGTETDGILLMLDTQGEMMYVSLGGRMRSSIGGTTIGAMLDRIDMERRDGAAAAAKKFFSEAETLER